MTRTGSTISSDEEEEGEEEVITEYEKERLQTIQRNRNVFANLQVKSIAASLQSPSLVAGATTVVPDRKKKRSVLQSTSGDGSRRRSERLSSIKGSKVVVDWSSNSSESGAAFAAGSESGSDVAVFFSSNADGKSKQKVKPKKKGKKKISLAELEDNEDRKKEDVEYEPSGTSDSDHSVDEEEVEQEAEEVTRGLLQSRKKKTLAKRPRISLKSPRKRTISLNSPSLGLHSPPGLSHSSDMEVDDDLALQQALALSMGSSVDITRPKASGDPKGKLPAESPHGRLGTKAAQKRPNKKGKKLYFNQSEIDAFFVSIVGSKEGRLSRILLESAASAHDFTWSKEELNDMIDIFDNDDDGQLNLDEFRKMAQHCKLMEAC